MSKYRAYGKQVMRDAEHVADAADATWAQIIVDALNGRKEPHVAPHHSTHSVTRHLDGYRCSCGSKWDADEGNECPKYILGI